MTMEIVKKSFLVLVITLIHLFLFNWVLTTFGFNFTSALLLNIVVVSWVAVTGQFVSFSLSSSYYRIRPFEQDNHLYEMFGTHIFRKLVGRKPWAILNPTLCFSGKVEKLPTLVREMQKAEAGHLLAFLIVTAIAAFAAVRTGIYFAVWLLLFNVPFNLYPVMLQRYNRARLRRIQEKSESKHVTTVQ